MDVIYIISIAAGGAFAALLLSALVYFLIVNAKNNERRRQLEKMYNDEHLAKMEYDVAEYDDETSRKLSGGSESQITIDDVLTDAVDKSDGIEEITGTYKPE